MVALPAGVYTGYAFVVGKPVDGVDIADAVLPAMPGRQG